MKILLVTPPLVQLNTPYPAMPVLTGFLRGQGQDVVQEDLSLALALRLFSQAGLEKVAEACRAAQQVSPAVRFFLENCDQYINSIEAVIAFLQGKNLATGWLIARRDYLPEGAHFKALSATGDWDESEEYLFELFGSLSVNDRAKYLASLYLDDLADVIREGVDPDFGFARYAEHLALSAPTFDFLMQRLDRAPTFVDGLIDDLAAAVICKHQPEILGLTLPFPGTVYGAFRIASVARRLAPDTRIVFGGGYVNTELRQLSDVRVFKWIDALCFDEGCAPWLGILGKGPSTRLATVHALPEVVLQEGRTSSTEVLLPPMPDYKGVDLTRYLDLLEMANPMHRLWSDGRWLKVQLANGCYWGKCAFCDVTLDYIRRYQPPRVSELVDHLVRLKEETGQSGFHFTDEAISPALVRALCDELISRKVTLTWWGNIRFDKAFTPELVQRMATAGCVAVTGGLECANDRLLKLMNKGITLAHAKRVLQAFSDVGILVHAYLMYGFPTQTEEETLGALAYVRDCFAAGVIQSAYWHRFALTVHSPIACQPERFNLRVCEVSAPARRFACNELAYEELGAPDLARLGAGLRLALYNYMLGQGLEDDVHTWFQSSPRKKSNARRPGFTG